MKHIVIIGNGFAGITTARHIRQQSDHRITVISAESAHFFSRTALMYIYMGHMTYQHTKPYEDWFWKKNRIDLVQAYVEHVDTGNKAVWLRDYAPIMYDTLVIATGSKPNKFGWPGQDLAGVQGLYSLQDLALMEQHTANIKRAVVVGGGLIGIEMAEMLRSRHIDVTFLVRESMFWYPILPAEEGQMIGRHLREHHVDLRMKTELREILPDEAGRVRAVRIGTGEEIDCQFVGLTVGVSPNVDFLQSSEIATNRGVLVNSYFETNVPDVYAIGDCAQFSQAPTEAGGAERKPIEQIWYTGRIHGETLAKTLCGERTAYEPGVFFNSAKFFDIEYQTYGQVVSPLPEGVATFFWKHPDGVHCLRINYVADDEQVVGIHAFGIRLRHAVCDEWLRNSRSLAYVLEHLPLANFDPEFFRQHEAAIISQYNQQATVPLRLKAKKGLFQ